MKDNIKDNLIQDFQLPKYVKGKSFAEASKAIDKKFEDRKDTFATKTKEELLERLASAQEYVKEQEQMKEIAKLPPEQQAEILQQQGGQEEQMSQEMAQNQGMDESMQYDPSQLDLMSQMGQPQQMAGGGLVQAGSTIGSMFGTAPQAEYGSEDAEAPTNFMNSTKDTVGSIIPIAGAFRSLEKGVTSIAQKTNGDEGAALSQAAFSPSDSIGKLVKDKDITGGERALGLVQAIFAPGAAGHIINKGNQRRKTKAETIATLQFNNQFDNDFAMGGYVDKKKKMMYGGFGEGEDYPKGSMAGFWNNLNTSLNPTIPSNLNTTGNMMDYGRITAPQKDTSITPAQNTPWATPTGKEYMSDLNQNTYNKPQTTAGKGLDWMGQNYGDIMSYAPTVANLLTKVKKPTTERGTRLENRYERQLVDEAALQNSVNQNNIQGALTESSGGDLGALRSNLIAGNLNKTKALSNAYLQASDINRNENKTAQQFNLNVDAQNMMQDERYIDRKGRDEAAYNDTKNAKRKAILDSIGNIGREESNKQLVKKLFGYTHKGNYWVDKDGKKVPSQTMEEILKNLNTKKEDKKD